MRSSRWDGTATAVSSVAHGGETLGTVTYLRRERFLMPDNTVEDVPVVSGNGLRALLRDTGADLLWQALGQPRMLLAAAHALWSGGALVKAKGAPLTGARLARAREVLPHLGVFGAAGGGRIIDGALAVGKLVPVCQETAHVLPESLTAGALPSIWDLVQIEYYSRNPAIPVGASEPPTVPGAEDGDPGLMRWGQETFVAGTRFHAWLALTNATEREHAFFTDVLSTFSEHARVGGGAARGHGLLRLDLTRTGENGPGAVGAAVADWQDLGGADPEEIRQILSWLD